MKKILKLITTLILVSMLSVSLIGCTEKDIYDAANEIANNSEQQIDAMAVSIFNAQFERYLGDRMKNQVVRVLISNVISNNDNDPYGVIKIAFKANNQLETSGDANISNDIAATSDKDVLDDLKNKIKSEKNFKVEATEYTTEGLISVITITEL